MQQKQTQTPPTPKHSKRYQVSKCLNGSRKVITATNDKSLADDLSNAVDLLLKYGIISFEDIKEAKGENVRTRRGVLICGRREMLKDWCGILGVSINTVRDRATKKKISPSDVLTQIIAERNIDVTAVLESLKSTFK